MNKYKIILTKEFEEELERIYIYIRFFLKEPNISKNIYNQIINSIYSLEYLPKRYYKLSHYSKIKNKDIRKLICKNYIIIYQVYDELRTGYNSTYIPSEIKII